jgi:hypothetical protein
MSDQLKLFPDNQIVLATTIITLYEVIMLVSLRTDDRGVSEVIGAILLFGMLIVAFATYQATVIPGQNTDIEVQHYEEVQDDLGELQGTIVTAAETGEARSTSVNLGPSYPSRALGVNSGPPSGQLRAESVGTGGIASTGVPLDETCRLRAGDGDRVPTNSLVYDPGYNYYESGEVSHRLEETLLYQPKSSYGGEIVRNDQTMVDTSTRSVTLYPLQSDLQSGGTGDEVYHFIGGYGQSRTVSDATVTIPTKAPQAIWQEQIGDGNPDVSVTNNGPETVNITFRGSWEFNCRPVGQDSAPEQVPTADAGTNTSVPEGSTVELDGAESQASGSITDYSWTLDSPPTGISLSNSNTATPILHASNANVPSDTDVTVELTINDTNGNTDTDTVTVTVTQTSSSDGDGDGSAYTTQWADPSSQTGVTCPDGVNGVCTVDASEAATVDLTATTSPTSVGTTIDYSVNDSGAGPVDPGEGETGAAGENNTVFRPTRNGAVTVFVAGGESSDAIELSVSNYAALVYNEDAVTSDGDGDTVAGGVTFSVTNRFGESVTITDIRVAPENSSIKNLNEGSFSTTEVSITADLADAYVDYVGGTDLPQTVDLDTDGFNDGNAQLSNGATATFSFYEFTDGSSSVDMSGEDVEITVTYQPTSGGTKTKTFTITPTTSGGGDSGGNQNPTIASLQTTDTSVTGGNPKYAQFDVDWAASDDSQVRSLELTMTRVNSGNEVDSATPSVSGTRASGVTSLRGPDQNSNPNGQQYDITIIVTDDDGVTSSQTQRVTVS